MLGNRSHLRTVAALLGVFLLWTLSVPASLAQGGFVDVDGDHFVLDGRPFQFVGVNLSGIAFKDDGEIDEQIGAASAMGAKVIRIFGANRALTASEVIAKLDNLFTRAESINPDLKFIVALTDFYNTEYIVYNDDGYYENGLLKPEWFEGGFRDNYKDFVVAVVSAFYDDPRIFSWEVGNELSYNLDSQVVIDFVDEMVSAMTDSTMANAQQLVSSGYISVQHAIGGNGDIGTVLSDLYPGQFDYVTIHTYNNEWSSPPCEGCPFSPQGQGPDINYSQSQHLPLVLGEFGFNGSFLSDTQCDKPPFPGGDFEDLHLPGAEKERTQDVKMTINKFYDEKGADGILQWGFMAGSGDNGIGDKCSGLDDGLHGDWGHNDWNNMTYTYQCRADSFARQFDAPSLRLPDVYVKGITWAPEQPIPGEDTTFTIRVYNGGTAATGSAGVGVGLFIGPPETNPFPDNQVGFAFGPGSLAPGAEIVMTVVAEAPAYGDFTVVAVADDVNRFEELAECNNALYLDVEAAVVSGAIDLCFAVDTTGSMGPYINAAQVAATAIVDAVFDVSSAPRVAVTDFRDYPVYPYGAAGDYPFAIRTDFTDQQSSITGGIQSLNLGNGRDIPESVYAGLIGCIRGRPDFYYTGPSLSPWRAEAVKAIILMGDAPPHEPEPISSYNLAQVTAEANAGGTTTSAVRLDDPLGPWGQKDSSGECEDGSYDGIRVFSIHIGSSSSAGYYFEALADLTCGRYINALTPEDVVEAILEVIGDIGNLPTNQPPVVEDAFPSVAEIWPPNHKWVSVTVLGVTDPEGEAVTITITGITQDEAVSGPGGNHSPDGDGVGTDVAWLRAERDGNGNGRIYKVSFTATDASGASAEGSVTVCVPHDQGTGACVDDGLSYDSTQP